jgi:hypothetical protein
MKHGSLTLCIALAGLLLGAVRTMAADSDSQGVEMYRAVYHFRATRGKDLPVCSAFLTRLNTAEFRSPPECGIPEETAVPGFVKLNKVSLSTDEVTELFPRVWGFTSKQVQLDQNQLALQHVSASSAFEALGHSLFAWRYEPPLSINNDGKSNNVLVWHGPGAFEAEQPGICGQVVMQGGSQGPVQPAQVAFVLTPDNKRIDEPQTRALFGRKNRNATVMLNGQPIETPELAPLGYYLGFFNYRGTYYMHTFHDSTHGDLEQKRYNIPSMNKALAVFRRTDGHTKQICEYQMSEKSLVGWTRQ